MSLLGLVRHVAEYARHCGHADLLRERIDGRVGQSPALAGSPSGLTPMTAGGAEKLLLRGVLVGHDDHSALGMGDHVLAH